MLICIEYSAIHFLLREVDGKAFRLEFLKDNCRFQYRKTKIYIYLKYQRYPIHRTKLQNISFQKCKFQVFLAS